jgi:hypothetical protein
MLRASVVSDVLSRCFTAALDTLSITLHVQMLTTALDTLSIMLQGLLWFAFQFLSPPPPPLSLYVCFEFSGKLFPPLYLKVLHDTHMDGK